ncbi:MAG: hypothetical protein ACRDIY_14050 [Chloroflexota bacterium]
MDTAIGLETESAKEPAGTEKDTGPDSGADVNQDGEFQGNY